MNLRTGRRKNRKKIKENIMNRRGKKWKTIQKKRDKEPLIYTVAKGSKKGKHQA